MIREPIASVSGHGAPFFSCSFSISGAITVANPSALAWIHPGRSTTSTGAVRSLATRPVNSRTSGRGALGPDAQLLDGVDGLGCG